MSKTSSAPHDTFVSRVLHHQVHMCESCRKRKARRHSSFCSQECAETFMYYD